MDKVLFVGHSLVGPHIPQLFNGFMESQSSALRADAQVINGAPLRYNWDNGASAEGVDAREVLPTGDYSTVIVTEAIPLEGQLVWNDSRGYAKRYADLAFEANADVQFYVYETWHELGENSQEWRDQISTDLAKWESIVDFVRDGSPAGMKEAQIIPAGQAMGNLHDAIEAGQVPGLSSIRELFDDNIHLNDLGNWFIAAVHAAVVDGLDASELPLEIEGLFGRVYFGPTQSQALSMAETIDRTLEDFFETPMEAPYSPGSSINIDGEIGSYIDFGGEDTYTLLPSISSDVQIADNDHTNIILPAGLRIDGARFLSDGAQFDINGHVVTLLGALSDYSFVFGGTPLDPNAGTVLDFAQTANMFGSSVPAIGEPVEQALILGIISDTGIDPDVTT